MRISIIIPIYNVELYLEDCLESILRQKIKFTEIEVLLVDDGSTDKSQSIAKRYVDKYPQLFSYYRKKNGGLSDARNYGIRKAVGEYLMFLDSDDELSDTICEKILKIISEMKIDIVVFNYIKFDNCELSTKQIPNKSTGYISKEEYLLLPPAAWNKLVRKSIFVKNSLEFPAGLWYEDRGLTGGFVNYTKSIYYLDDVGYHYRTREGSITQKSSFNEKMLDIFPVMDLVYDQLSNTKYINELEFIFIENLIASFAATFLPFERKKEVTNAISIVNEKFPNWKRNIYLKKKSFKYKFLCQLLYYKQLRIVSIILRRFKNEK